MHSEIQKNGECRCARNLTFSSISQTHFSDNKMKQNQMENKNMKRITNTIYAAVALLALACFAISPSAQAVSPPPDGGYPGGNTAEGQNALLALTSGGYNTAVGFLSLKSNVSSGFNTAVGAGTLFANIGDSNTAIGAVALLRNTTGTSNTAVGDYALFNNATGSGNIALGPAAGSNLTTGDNNINIGSAGVAGESGAIRIGDPDIHQSIFLAGITPITGSPSVSVVMVDPDRKSTRLNSSHLGISY